MAISGLPSSWLAAGSRRSNCHGPLVAPGVAMMTSPKALMITNGRPLPSSASPTPSGVADGDAWQCSFGLIDQMDAALGIDGHRL